MIGKDSNLLMFNGSIKQICDIKTGDVLMGINNNPAIVRYNILTSAEMYKISPVKGDPFNLSISHCLYGKRKVSIIERDIFLNLKTYLESDRMAFKERLKLCRSTAVEFNTNDTLLIEPYFLGIWLGDGDSSSQKITNPDNEIIEYLTYYASSMHMKIANYTPLKTASALCISNGKIGTPFNNSLLNNMRYYNLINNKHIPDCYLLSSIENRLMLLAGLLDSDGHLHANGGYEITFKSKHLMNQTRFLIKSLGIAAYTSDKIATCQTANGKFKGLYYRTSISGNLDVIPCKVKRKQAQERNQVKNVLRTGFSVDKIGYDNCYNIMVDNNFIILDNFTIICDSSIIGDCII